MSMGREGNRRYASLVERIEEAEDLAEAALVAALRTHASRDAKVALALLERRFGARWSRRDSPDAGRDLEDAPAGLSDEERQRLRRIAARADEQRAREREATEGGGRPPPGA